MELRHLETFVQVAKQQSFSKAAKCLGYSQAAITIQIQQLEETLGSPLFERFHKRIALTQKGELFLIHAMEILQAVDVAQKSVCDDGIVEGVLRIGTIESLCTSILPTLFTQFHQRYPNVQVRICTGSPQELLTQLHQNQLDLVYILDTLHYDQNLIKCFEEKEDIVFVCGYDHPLRKKKQIHLADILEEEMILTEQNASYRALFEAQLAKRELYLQPVLEVGNTDFIIKILEHNSSVSLLPRIAIAPYVEEKRLAILDPDDFTMEIWCQLIYHKHKWLTSQMQAFLQLAQPKEKSKP